MAISTIGTNSLTNPLTGVTSTTVTSTGDASISGLTVGKGLDADTGSTAVGYQALSATTTALNQTAVGYQALKASTSGNANQAFGYKALFSTNTGVNNFAGGHSALYSNTSGSYNVSIGREALYSNTTASNNTAVGYQAGYSNTTGTRIVNLGTYAGYTNSTGTDSVCIGYAAGYNATGSYNTFVGARNSAGNACGELITTGSKNTILGGYNGNQGGLDIRTASNYIVLSDGDGNPCAWCSPNLFSINSPSGQRYTQFNFDNAATQKASLWWDNSSLLLQTYTSNYGPYITNGSASWTNYSDERLKNITGEISNSLEKVSQLRAAEFTWKDDSSNKPCVGLIAQDVITVLPEAVTKAASRKDDETEYYGVSYTDVIPLLVGAIKELKAEVDSLKQQLASK